MKYRFLGDKDVPDWVLAEVSTLSRISCVRLKLLSRQVINQLTGGGIDNKKVEALVRGVGLSTSDIKATLATLNFFLSNATKYAVDAQDFNVELQQLGLPKENSDGVARPFRINREKLITFFKDTSLQMPRMVASDWAVDLTIASSIARDTNVPSVQLQLHLSHAMEEPQPINKTPSSAAAATSSRAVTPGAAAGTGAGAGAGAGAGGNETPSNAAAAVTIPSRPTDPFTASLRRPAQRNQHTLGVTLSRDKFRVFHAELKALQAAMKQTKKDLE